MRFGHPPGRGAAPVPSTTVPPRMRKRYSISNTPIRLRQPVDPPDCRTEGWTLQALSSRVATISVARPRCVAEQAVPPRVGRSLAALYLTCSLVMEQRTTALFVAQNE